MNQKHFERMKNMRSVLKGAGSLFAAFEVPAAGVIVSLRLQCVLERNCR